MIIRYETTETTLPQQKWSKIFSTEYFEMEMFQNKHVGRQIKKTFYYYIKNSYWF